MLLETRAVFATPNTTASPVIDAPPTSYESTEGLDEITARVAVISFIGGASAVVYGLLGICTAKV